ncbi:hypothetical protein WISP_06659 [Willisornis vidua]|uniref:Uncharacterized protein n=1 Tax=Willisornis vidua TaxID=1566151 RepID=A0ABQ9DX91_9PASS|nr:hypothetical protein WISP_06659 [Willisornis vidua]
MNKGLSFEDKPFDQTPAEVSPYLKVSPYLGAKDSFNPLPAILDVTNLMKGLKDNRQFTKLLPEQQAIFQNIFQLQTLEKWDLSIGTLHCSSYGKSYRINQTRISPNIQLHPRKTSTSHFSSCKKLLDDVHQLLYKGSFEEFGNF